MLPKGKQFDFSETTIFGRFDLFCRRVLKLIDMFRTIHQFKSLSQHRFEGMEDLVNEFKKMKEEFTDKRHDLLDFGNNRFDRDYVEFNVRISDLEGKLRILHARGPRAFREQGWVLMDGCSKG